MRLAHELDDGGEYGVVLTTAGGLWRYRLGDRVRVEGRLHATPSLRLVGRTDGVVDRVGEKLSPGFVGAVLARLVPGAAFAMLAPSGDAYTLFTSGAADPAALDAALCGNPHFDHARRLGQLGPTRVRRVGPDAFARYAARRVALGRRLGDLKPEPLSGRTDWACWLR